MKPANKSQTAEEHPLVSVIITTYNRENLICEAIETVLNQTYPNIELFVIDDDSEYDIEEKTREYSEEVNLIVNEVNKGANWSRAKGISESNGRYVAFLDDDDRWYPEKIEKQVAVLEEADLSTGAVAVGIIKTTNGVIRTPSSLDGAALTRKLLAGHNVIGGFSVIMVRRSVIESVGLPDGDFDSAQDLEWYIRLSVHCDIETLQEPLVRYNDSIEQSITAEKKNQQDDSYGQILDKHSSLVNEYGEIFRRKCHSKRHRKIAFYAALSDDYATCRKHALLSLEIYPFQIRSILYLLIGLTGTYGFNAVKKMYEYAGRSSMWW